MRHHNPVNRWLALARQHRRRAVRLDSIVRDPKANNSGNREVRVKTWRLAKLAYRRAIVGLRAENVR